MAHKIGLKLKKLLILSICTVTILTLAGQTAFAETLTKTKTADELK